MRLNRILETCLYVDDLTRAREFYEETLGLPLYSAVDGRHVFFKLSNGMFLLFNAAATRGENSELPGHGAEGAGHAAFSVEEDELARWREHLENAGVAIEHEQVWPNGARSLYFRDPARNVLELATPSLWDY